MAEDKTQAVIKILGVDTRIDREVDRWDDEYIPTTETPKLCKIEDPDCEACQ